MANQTLVNKWTISAAMFALVVGVTLKMKTNINRNVRNNNPLNIESRDNWDGLSPEQNDSRFAVFTTPDYGFRAAYIILLKYLERGDDTILKIVSKWAPSVENHTDAYAAYIAKKMQRSIDALVLPDDLVVMMVHMANYEGAKGAYDDMAAAIAGVELAHESGYVVARLERLGVYVS